MHRGRSIPLADPSLSQAVLKGVWGPNIWGRGSDQVKVFTSCCNTCNFHCRAAGIHGFLDSWVLIMFMLVVIVPAFPVPMCF